jgi:hypothetical protein
MADVIDLAEAREKQKGKKLAEQETAYDVAYRGGYAEGIAEGIAEGFEKERQRHKSVLYHENATGRFEQAILLLGKTDLTAEQCIGLLGAMPKNVDSSQVAATSITFAQAMAALKNPEIDLCDDDSFASPEQTEVSRSLAIFSQYQPRIQKD